MYWHPDWLISVQNGDLVEESPPAWVAWESNDNYLPAAFYDPKSTSSLSTISEFVCWVGNDPITANGDTLASYDQVELVALGFGLACRAFWVVQFPGIYSNLPHTCSTVPIRFLNMSNLVTGSKTLYPGISTHKFHQ